MKILLVTHLVPYPPRGGCSLRNFNLIKECSKRHEIHLLTFYQKAHLYGHSNLGDNIKEMQKYCKEVRVFEIPTDGKKLRWSLLLLLNLFSSKPYSTWRFHSKEMVNAVKEAVNTESFDLMEIGTIALAEYSKLAPNLPKLLVHHNIESELLIRRAAGLKNPLARAYVAHQGRKLRNYEKEAARFFDYHTTVSDRDGETLKEADPGANVQTVPNGVDTEYFTSINTATEENSLIFIGAPNWFPNLDAMTYLIRDIWHLITAEIPDLSMYYIGKNPPPEIKKFAEHNPSFKPLGFVDDVRPYMSRASVYIVPIRIGGGTRLKILDAMSMSSAIVSTSIGCEGIDVSHGKDILIADSPETIARETIRLLKDNALRTELGENARATAERLYSWKVVAPKLEWVYNQLAGMRE